ncbi:TATA-box binding protein TBP1 [Cardiosporidium cionae]|uniref:TATA-box binding protein TBP1 n=1 Tax=Cardiosporidium cionae TaxID=476202 RepID=A0ABQ7J4Z4_9APIC|nr:TATA-box binding protein TBP1 [Cardiosporidium cionae]|eukprot:KAF8819037.1 TATA-box binding protein TBP1 [Cardiosporidium cionae]
MEKDSFVNDEANLEKLTPVTKDSLVLHNVLATADLCYSLDLDALCPKFGNAEYFPEEFHALKIEVRTPRTNSVTLVSIFSNGKVTATGGNSIEETYNALKKIVRRIANPPISLPVKLNAFEVANVLCVYNCGFRILLNKLFRIYRETDYEPERCAAAIIRVAIKEKSKVNALIAVVGGSEPPSEMAWDTSWEYGDCSNERGSVETKMEVVTLKIFSTGNITLLGARRMESLDYAIGIVKPYLLKCKAGPSPVANLSSR